MTRTILALVAGLCFLAPVSAQADTIYCSGNVIGVWTYSNGNLTVTTSFRDGMIICNVNDIANSVAASTCRSWQAILTSAYLSGKPTNWAFNVSAGITCASLPNYGNSVPPSYVMMTN